MELLFHLGSLLARHTCAVQMCPLLVDLISFSRCFVFIPTDMRCNAHEFARKRTNPFFFFQPPNIWCGWAFLSQGRPLVSSFSLTQTLQVWFPYNSRTSPTRLFQKWVVLIAGLAFVCSLLITSNRLQALSLFQTKLFQCMHCAHVPCRFYTVDVKWLCAFILQVFA